MATSGSFNTSKVGEFYFTFSWSRTSYDSVKNEHNIKYSVVAHNTPGYYRTVYLKKLVINGTTKLNTENGVQYEDGDTVTSGTMTIKSSNEAGDGSISASFEAGVGSFPGSNCSGSDEWALDRIPRKPTSVQSLNSKTETTIKMNWSSDSTIKSIKYSTDGGTTFSKEVNVTDGKSGTYTISGLTANTTYKVVTKVIRADNGLDKDSSALSVTTYNYPYCTSSPNFTIGDSLKISLYNPLGRSVTITMVAGDGSTKTTGSYTGTSVSGFSNSDWSTFWYKSIPKATSGKYQVKVNYGSINTETRNNGNTYSANPSNCIPTFSNCTYEDRGSVSTVLTGNDNQTVINGYNSFYVIISTANKAKAKNEAKISKYRLVCGNQSVEEKEVDGSEVILKLAHITNMTFVVYAIDTRGYSQSITKSVTTWKDYFNPSITTGVAERTEQVNEATQLTFSGKIWGQNFGGEQNGIRTCTYKYKKTSASTYTTGTTTITPTLSGNTFSASLLIEGDSGANGFSISSSYNIQITLSDRIRTITYDIILNAGTPAVAIGQGGVCFGGAYSEAHGGLIQLPTSKYFANRNTTA